jgi:hypothetical protein
VRGTPFIHEGWTGGLNTIDSPYTIEDTESRDCLNVVSTTRGSIKKRTGSTLFSEAVAAFPASLPVTDSFERANEDPLSNDGQWSRLPEPGNTGTGKIETNRWRVKETFPVTEGALWRTEQEHPAVSVQIATVPPQNERIFGLWACLPKAALTHPEDTTNSGYFLRFEVSIGAEHKHKVTLERWEANVKTVLETAEPIVVESGDSIGMTVLNGKVTGWRKHAGIWSEVTSHTDTAFTTGFQGIEANGTSVRMANFSLGKAVIGEPAPSGVELTSIFPVVVSSVKWLIAAGGTKVYKISTAGAITELGGGFTSNLRWSIVEAPTGTGVASMGPVYLSNGTDAPQTWTGTELKEWTGVAAAVEKTDGEIVEGLPRLSSKTANFQPSDVGLLIEGEGIPANTTVFAVVNPTTIELSQNATATGTTKHFTLKRSYYETGGKHVPKGKYMIFAGNRIWMTGISSDPSAVWFSELVSIGEGGAQGDPTAWPKTNVVRFDSSDGKPITGIGLAGPYVVVFKERKTWVIHDLNTGANRRIADTIGCVSHRSIVETTGGTFFLTADAGVYVLEGSRLQELSYKVRPTILGINQEKREQATGAYFGNHYYVSFPSGTSATNNRTLDYDAQLKTWWLHDVVANQWAVWEPSGETNLYAARPGASKGVIRAFVPGVFTDVEENYAGAEGLAAYWKGAWLPFYMFIFRHRVKTPQLKKRLRMIHLDGSGEVIPTVYKEFEIAGTQMAGVPGAKPETEPELPIKFSAGEQLFANTNEEQIFGGELFQGLVEIFGGATVTQGARIYSLGTADVWSIAFGNSTSADFQIDSYTTMGQFRKS